MRIMIWCDMEGGAGIEAWEQVDGGAPLYEEGRRLYTEEVNAAVRGAKKAGAAEIVVVDGHGSGSGWNFKSIIPERMEPGATYVQGYRWASYVEPLEQGCDAALFVGAHAMAGTPDGVLCHTLYSEAWHNAYINNQVVGESGIVAAICGNWNTPCVFVAGDEATCREVQGLLGQKVVTAPVKKGLGRYAARNMTPVEARVLIEDRVSAALTKRDFPPPYQPSAPVTFEVELATPDKSAPFVGRTGVEVIGPRRVRSVGPNFWVVWDQLWHH